MKYDVNNHILNTVCQKCNVIPAKVPLIDLELAPGILFIPEILHCSNCGAQLTVQVREYTKEELKKKKEDALAKAILYEKDLKDSNDTLKRAADAEGLADPGAAI